MNTLPESYGIAVERGLRELSGEVGVADFVLKRIRREPAVILVVPGRLP